MISRAPLSWEVKKSEDGHQRVKKMYSIGRELGCVSENDHRGEVVGERTRTRG
jgi:hypothetical protein